MEHSLMTFFEFLGVILLIAFVLTWIFFPFLLFDRMRKERKLLEEIRDNTQASAHYAQQADYRARESVSLADQQCR